MCKAARAIRHQGERHTMAMPNIHMVQRLQGRMNEVDELVVVDCYGKRKQYLLEKTKDEMKKEKKQKL